MRTATSSAPAKQAAHARMARFDRSRVKVANLGGDGNDEHFSQAFSSLVHAYVRDKAPSLLDHEQGFQLLERNEDNTKAVGILAFKAGSQHLFVPSFFLQGDLKGHELLYIQEQDLFVPLKENWLNYLLNRKPHILGDGVTRDLSHIGVRQPNLQRLRMSPYKYATAYPEKFRPAVAKFAATAQIDMQAEMAAFRESMSLPRFLKQANMPLIRQFIGVLRKYPKIAATVERLHGLDFITEAIKLARARQTGDQTDSVLDYQPGPCTEFETGPSVLAPVHPTKTGALKIYTYKLASPEPVPAELTEADRSQLLRAGVLIKDAREDENTSLTYKVTGREILTNPAETGLFDILAKQGEMHKCFVTYQPHGANGRANFSTVVSLEGEPSWANVPASEVWSAKEYLEDETLEKWIKSLPAADSLPVSKTALHMLVGPRGEATLPFRVKEEIVTEQGSSIYEVDFEDYCRNPGPPKAYGSHNRDYEDPYEYSSYSDGQRIHLKGAAGSAIRSSHGDVYVPAGFKLLTLRPDKDEKKDDKDDGPSCGCGGMSDPAPFRPGNIVDVESEIMQKTAEVKVYNDGLECEVNGNRMTPLQGLIHLVRDHGFREKTARDLLQEAQKGRKASFRVKYALPYLTNSGPQAPPFPVPESSAQNPMSLNDRTPFEPIMEQHNPVPEMSASLTDPWLYNPNNYVDPMSAQPYPGLDAQGKRPQHDEMFDTNMISSMLKATSDDSIIDRYVPDLIKGMDRLGRLLFMFYWHMKAFADRYGNQGLPELEDSLRNAFEMVGDVCLFLKQKSVEPYPEEADLDLGLDRSADV